MNIRVYYEDTDAAGIVYHANYLKFLERARTEFLRDRGLSVAELASLGHVFPVVRMELDLIKPARHDDLLLVITEPAEVRGSSFTLRQQIIRHADRCLLVDGLIRLACVGPGMRAKRIPDEVRQVLKSGLKKDSGTAGK